MKIADILAQSAKKAKISLNIKRLSNEDYQTAFTEKDYDILLTKEKIRCCDNLASKLDFNGKYEVPYEIYTELANILKEDKTVEEFRTDRVIIEALDDSRFELDGEIIEDRYLDIKVVPNKLKMFM